ncbi:MAG: hypothetical protein U0350_43095 [Caldilineaceae bacterium]
MDQEADKAKNYDAFLIEELCDPELAAEYLLAAVEDGSVEQLLLALRAVAEAQRDVVTVADFIYHAL